METIISFFKSPIIGMFLIIGIAIFFAWYTDKCREKVKDLYWDKITVKQMPIWSILGGYLVYWYYKAKGFERLQEVFWSVNSTLYYTFDDHFPDISWFWGPVGIMFTEVARPYVEQEEQKLREVSKMC